MPFTDEDKPLKVLVLPELENAERAVRARCNNAPLMIIVWGRGGQMHSLAPQSHAVIQHGSISRYRVPLSAVLRGRLITRVCVGRKLTLFVIIFQLKS